MKKLTLLLILVLNIGLLSSCKNKSSKNNTSRSQYNSSYSYETEYNEDGYDEDGYNEDGYNEDGYNEDGYNEDGRDEYGKDEYGHIEDGTYTATVDYYNPSTGYSATYTSDVEVEGGEVTVIYFPNDGYLDDDHIYPSELDDSGYVSIDGEEGKTYDVQIDI